MGHPAIDLLFYGGFEKGAYPEHWHTFCIDIVKFAFFLRLLCLNLVLER